MNSTLICTATPAPARALVDAVLLPAATSAPAALVIAVDAPVSQETSALTQVVAGTAATAVVAAHAYAAVMPFSAVAARVQKNRDDVTGPPSRGTPV